MPWKENSVVDQRLDLIARWKSGEYSIAELARLFGISRKTVYKFITRWHESQHEALVDRSRRPRSCPHQTPPGIVHKILEKRSQKPNWGPQKILDSLTKEGVASLPAPSTVAGILKRHGVVTPRKKHQRSTPSSSLIDAQAPNEVWCTDFKGWFRVGTGQRCDPLTLIDSYSRYLLCCHGFFGRTRFEEVWEVYQEVFAAWGLPRYILSDNGAPFASTGMAGLTRLSVAWIKLGITPLRIVPGRPQQNGRLERFHRTLGEETARPPAATAAVQQERFQAFREEYNRQRPHQALGGDFPAEHYTPSTRLWKGLPAGFEYPESFEVRWVQKRGEIAWAGRRLSLSTALHGEMVGLELSKETTEATVYLGDYALCVLDLATGKTKPVPRPVHLLWLKDPGAKEKEEGSHPVIPVMPVSLE